MDALIAQCPQWSVREEILWNFTLWEEVFVFYTTNSLNVEINRVNSTMLVIKMDFFF